MSGPRWSPLYARLGYTGLAAFALLTSVSRLVLAGEDVFGALTPVVASFFTMHATILWVRWHDNRRAAEAKR